MIKNIVILGSTGTIGINTLEVISNSKEHNILAISANKNIKLLISQIEKFQPKYVSLGIESEISALKRRFPETIFYYNNIGLKKIATLKEADLIISAIVGFAGFLPTYEALKADKLVALANKESLVAGGMFLKDYNHNIIPLDSEHSAIFQLLNKRDNNELKNIILTASGGPFWKKDKREFKDITIKDALNHPNWDMGDKITIDSSTMMNKTLEIIEAHYLFNLDYKQIKVVIHPQSIIHSMITLKDNSILAQLASPDMKIPISQALYYPKLDSFNYKSIDFTKILNLDFYPIDYDKFPILKFAKEVIENPYKGVILNSTNEVAVEMFLKKKIKWCDIYKIIDKVVNNYPLNQINSIIKLIEIDKDVKLFTQDVINDLFIT